MDNLKLQRSMPDDDDALLAELDRWVAEQEPLDKEPSVTTIPVTQPANEPRALLAPTTSKTISPASKTVPAAAVRAPAPYGFPLGTLKKGFSSDELHGQMVSITRNRALPYGTIRDEYCGLNLAMNEAKLRPPAFRSMRKRPPTAKGIDFDLLTRDNMIIDLHWLHTTGMRKVIDESEFRDLFNTETFEMRAAEAFVQKNWKMEIRLLRMGLSDVDQWQMSTFRSREVREKIKVLQERRFELASRLRGLIQKGARLQQPHADDFADLWFASELAKNASHLLVAQVHAWYRGAEVLDAATISLKLKRMREWVRKAEI